MPKFTLSRFAAAFLLNALGFTGTSLSVHAQNDEGRGSGGAPGHAIDVFDASPAPDNAAVQQLLRENPGSELIICIAGCRGAGVPVIMMKRPSKIALRGTAGGSELIVAAADVGRASTNGGDEVVCLAGCVGESGTIVFHGRQHAWIRPHGHETLATAMADYIARLASSEHHTNTSTRTWVSPNARESLTALAITQSGGALVVSSVN